MKRGILFFLLASLFLSRGVVAGEVIEIECPECQYKTQLEDGPGKAQAVEKLPYAKVFFCKGTRKFVSLKVDADGGKSDPATAKKTWWGVDWRWSARIFSHESCKDGLIPLGYYTDKKNTTCPICEKGPLRITTLMTYD